MSESEAVAAPPHWLPEDAWMGVQIGEWPLQAFPSQEMAALWAASDKRRRIWKVTIPAETATFAAEHVPATHRLRQTS